MRAVPPVLSSDLSGEWAALTPASLLSSSLSGKNAEARRFLTYPQGLRPRPRLITPFSLDLPELSTGFHLILPRPRPKSNNRNATSESDRGLRLVTPSFM